MSKFIQLTRIEFVSKNKTVIFINSNCIEYIHDLLDMGDTAKTVVKTNNGLFRVEQTVEEIMFLIGDNTSKQTTVFTQDGVKAL